MGPSTPFRSTIEPHTAPGKRKCLWNLKPIGPSAKGLQQLVSTHGTYSERCAQLHTFLFTKVVNPSLGTYVFPNYISREAAAVGWDVKLRENENLSMWNKTAEWSPLEAWITSFINTFTSWFRWKSSQFPWPVQEPMSALGTTMCSIFPVELTDGMCVWGSQNEWIFAFLPHSCVVAKGARAQWTFLFIF